MAVSREAVIHAFELVLGRTPDETLIAYHAGLPFADERALADYLIKTDEFRARYDRFVEEGLAPPSRSPQLQSQQRPVTVFLGDRVLTATHRGHKIYVAPTDIDLGPHIMMHGLWEPHVERAVVSQLRPGQVAADIGANIGYHTLAMAASVGGGGHVHAFEANPEIVRLLKPTIFINGCAGFVTLYNRAVMDKPGVITLALAPDHYGSGNVVPPAHDGNYDADYSRRHLVEGVTLDATLAGLAALDLVRIDIEGSEPQALRGGEALIRRSPEMRIVAEWSVGMMSARADVPAFIAWLGDMGFRFWLISPSGALFQPVAPSALMGLPHSDVYISRQDPM